MENRDARPTPNRELQAPSDPERTQQMESGTAAAEPTRMLPASASGSDPLRESARRRQLEAELARLGMTADEVRKLLSAGEGAGPAAETGPSPHPARSQDLVGSAASDLAGLAASMQADIARRRAADAGSDSTFPEFRGFTPAPEAVRISEQLLRDAYMHRRRERYSEAEAACRQAIALTPGDAAALELLGDLLQGVARVTEALAAYRRALEIDPRRASAERKYGDLLMRQQDWSAIGDEQLPRNAWISLLFSLLLPGAGQFNNRDWGKGLLFLALDLLCVYLLAWSPWGFSSGRMGAGVSPALLLCMTLATTVFVAAMIDANVSARRGVRRNRQDSWKV